MEKGALLSRLRARCPDCRTYTAVALGAEYECHACGRTFAAGLVRVPKAWGDGGEQMVEAAWLPLPYPEAEVVDEDSLRAQTLALAAALPELPLVLGGCCCTHVGAVEGLAARYGRLAVVWIDAHGDLNTPETSPSGNAWGMPLRMLLDAGTVDPQDVVLVGARNLDPPEEAFIAEIGLATGADGVERALDEAEHAYVAVDCDGLDPAELSPFMPEPDGLSVADAEGLLARVRERAQLVGAGFTGLTPDPRNLDPIRRLCIALGL